MAARKPPTPVIDNIETVAKLEQEFDEQRTLADRIGDAVAAFAGSMKFVLLHLAWFLTWIGINAKWIPGIPAFDPYPFIFLSMVVSLEAVLLSTFVLMKQNRMSLRSERRNHLNLQVDLLSEQELTKVLQMLKRISDQIGVKFHDDELKELSENTAVAGLAEELKEKLPDC